MSRRRKKNKKSFNYNSYNYTLPSSDSKDVKSIALQIFGSSDYIDYNSLTDM